MWFLAIGLVLLVMKLAEVGPGADWPWWGVAIPFGLAAAWWAWAWTSAAGVTAATRSRLFGLLELVQHGA